MPLQERILSGRTLYLDFETRCKLDLTEVGAYRYVEHPSFHILLIAVAVDDGEVLVFEPEEAPALAAYVRQMLQSNRLRRVAHNVAFERLVTARWLGGLVEDSLWDCTAARARMCGLPGSLEGAARALGLPVQKDVRGKKLIKLLCMPRPDGSFNDDPALMAAFKEYAGRDVQVARTLDQVLPPLPPYERRVFLYDLKLNDRGVGIDVGLVEASRDVAHTALTALNMRMALATDNAITTVMQRGRLSSWLAARSIEHTTLDRNAVTHLLAGPLPDDARTVLNLRQEGARTSHTKLDQIGARTSNDGRLRGMLLYYGAGTGRHSSIGVNLQNLPRPERDWSDIVAGIDDLMTGDADYVHMLHGSPLALIADTLRSVLVPAEGHVFEIADLNAIELRGCAWLCGEQWVLDALERDEDVYCAMASAVFGRAITRADARERFLGKTLELAGQYGMGWRRYQATCEAQGVSISEELARDGVATYRDKHPRIVAAWWKLQKAAMAAVEHPGRECVACGVVWCMRAGRLYCTLPSGRSLIYCEPELTVDNNGYPILGFSGVSSTTHQYLPQRAWGAMLLENIVQGMCRDILMELCWRLETVGHRPVVLIVHDEIVAEVKADEADIGLVERLMSTPIAWAKGLPLAAKGSVEGRYRKL